MKRALVCGAGGLKRAGVLRSWGAREKKMSNCECRMVRQAHHKLRKRNDEPRNDEGWSM